jgi:hypothetical protein
MRVCVALRFDFYVAANKKNIDKPLYYQAAESRERERARQKNTPSAVMMQLCVSLEESFSLFFLFHSPTAVSFN